MAFLKNEIPKIETQNTNPKKKKAVPKIIDLYGFLNTKKKGGDLKGGHQADGSARILRSHRKVDEANGYGSCGFGMLCRKSVVGLGWGIRSEKRIMLVEMCFNFVLVKKNRNELEYLFGGKFWIFLGNRRRKRVLNKSWWLLQKKSNAHEKNLDLELALVWFKEHYLAPFN